MDPEPFLVEQLLSDLSVILSANLGQKNLDVLFDMDPAIPPCLVGDAMRIKQILINLGGNAVKFTAQGQVVIQWQLARLHDDRARVEISVRDSGIGIAPENQGHIFEGFSQAEANTTRRFGGTGLGLAISLRLIRLMGGELTLSSALGSGSTFSFVLDLPVGQMSTGAPRVRAPELGTRVLLVDDNPVALHTGATMMRSLGWTVVESASGEQALEQVRMQLASKADAFKAIFVDWQMPDMDGWQTLRQMRRLYSEGDAPVMIMLSGQGRELLNQRTAREQELLNGFLVKPLTAAMCRHALAHAYDMPVSAEEQDDDTGNAQLLRARRLSGLRILVVEDNPINQQVARELLMNEGADITLADNGRLGVDAVASAAPQFDVVLMDLQMPVMDGLSAARAIRSELGLATLPVIAMTANAMASDRAACLEAGMNDHVGKPFDLNHLVRVVLQHTQGGGIGGVGSAASAQSAEPDLPNEPALLAPTAPAIVWPAGVDGDVALARMGGNTGLFSRTLKSFIADNAVLADRLGRLVAANDLAALQRELHALKGLSATLGLGALSALAAEAEAASKIAKDAMSHPATKEISRLTELLVSIRSSVALLEPVLQNLAMQLDDPKSAEAESGTNASTDGVQLLDQLRVLLKVLLAGDMEAMELHATLRQSCGDDLGSAMEPLDAAMAELDFELAATECETLVEHLTQ
jgi:CheY-like chemotaxis protein